MKKIFTLIEENSENWFGRFIPATSLKSFSLSGNAALHGKLNHFVFEGQNKAPFVVAKTSRNYRYVDFLKNDYEKLLKISRINGIKGIPVPYHYQPDGPDSFSLQSFLPGVPIYNDFNRIFLDKRYSDKADAVLKNVFLWIADFHKHSAEKHCREELAGCFSKNQIAIDLGTDMVVPVGTIHGDFWLKNILIDDSGNINVTDWEWAEGPFPLVWDILFFISTLLVQLLKAHRLNSDNPAAVQVCRDKSGWLFPLLAKKIDAYFVEFSIKKVDLQVVQKSFFLYLSLRTYRKYGLISAEDEFWKRMSGIIPSLVEAILKS